MPFDIEQRKAMFKHQGLQEDLAYQYDVLDDGSVVPIKQQPIPTPKVEPKMGMLEAAGTRLKAQAIPLATGLIGSAALGAMTGGYSIPVQIGAKLIGMLGGGALGNVGQNELGIIDQQKQQKAMKDQYLASLAADLAPSVALGRFNPSNIKSAYQTATAIPDAIRTARSVRGLPGLQPGFLSSQQLAAGQITREGLENLANVGVGAGLPAVMNVAAPMVRGEDVDWTYAIPNILAGAAFNEPRSLRGINPMYRKQTSKVPVEGTTPVVEAEAIPSIGPTGRQATVFSKDVKPTLDPLTGKPVEPLMEIRKKIEEENSLMRNQGINPEEVPVGERPLIVQKLKENLPPIKTELPIQEGANAEVAANIVKQRQDAIANRYVDEQAIAARKRDFEIAKGTEEDALAQRAMGQEQLKFESEADKAAKVIADRQRKINLAKLEKAKADDWNLAQQKRDAELSAKSQEWQAQNEVRRQQMIQEGSSEPVKPPMSKEEIDARTFAKSKGTNVAAEDQSLGVGVNAKMPYAPPNEYSTATLGVESTQPRAKTILHEVVHKLFQQLKAAGNKRILEYESIIVKDPEFIAMKKMYEDANQPDFSVEEFTARKLEEPVTTERSNYVEGKSKYGIGRMMKGLVNEAKMLTKTGGKKDYLDYIETVVSQKRDFQAEYGKPLDVELKNQSMPEEGSKKEPVEPSKEVFSKNLNEPVAGETPDQVKLGLDSEPKSLGTMISEFVGSVLNKTKGQIEQIKDKGIANSLSEVLANKNEILGRFRNRSSEIIDKLKQDQKDLLYRVLIAERNGRKEFKNQLSGDTYKAYLNLREILAEKQDYQNELGILIDGRQAKKDPFYVPMMASKEAIKFLTSEETTPQKTQLENDFIQHQMKRLGVSKEKATALMDVYKKSFEAEIPGSSIDFGAVRRAEGIGLPDSWLEKDFGRLLDRYWNRVATDFSWWKNVESNPELNGRVQQASSSDTVGPVINAIKGTRAAYHPNIEAWGRLSNSLVTSGPKSGVRDLINAIWNSPRLAPNFQTILEAGHSAITEWNQSKLDSFKNGFNRRSLSDFQEFVKPEGELSENLNSFSNFLSKISGRQKLEEFARIFTQGFMKVLVAKNKEVANGVIPGNAKYSKWLLDKMANGRDWTKMENDVLASRFGETVQGTYDPRNIPAWMSDSDFAPLFKLARWSVDQFNQTRKYVLEPALKAVKPGTKLVGDDVPPALRPLLTTIGISGVLGGLVTQAATSLMSGKENREPTFKEISSSEGPDEEKTKAYAYKLASILSASGTLGIVGDTLRIPFDALYGNNPRLLRNALQEPIAILAEKSLDGLKAFSENPDEGLEILKNVVWDITRLNMQLARTAYEFGFKPEKDKLDEEGYRDIRTFRNLEGRGSAKPSDFNPYMNLKQRKFKKTESLDEAKELLPRIKQDILEDSNGDREFVKRKLKGLKQNSYQIYPSTPQEAKRYNRFLQETEGEEEANTRFERFKKQSRINRMKSSMVY